MVVQAVKGVGFCQGAWGIICGWARRDPRRSGMGQPGNGAGKGALGLGPLSR